MPARFLPLLALILMLPAPTLAQDGTGAAVAPRRPAPRAALPAPPAPSLAESIDDPATLLRLAGQTLAGGRMREALDLLERAEARLLTRSELATQAGSPEQGGAIGEIAAARAALGTRDRAVAAMRIDQALARLDRRPPQAQAPAFTPDPAPLVTAPPVSAAPLAQRPLPLPGIAPQDMPVGGTASPPVPFGPDTEYPRAPAGPGEIPPSSSKGPG